MEIAIVLGCLAIICVGLGLWFQTRLGRIPKNYTTVDFPIPSVAFPFEPLTELAAECASKFTELPLASVPQVMICPATYVTKGTDAIYHPKNNHIYFKDTYANAASPESLMHTMLKQTLYAWLWQHREFLLGDLKADDRTFDACFEVASVFVGLREHRFISVEQGGKTVRKAVG